MLEKHRVSSTGRGTEPGSAFLPVLESFSAADASMLRHLSPSESSTDYLSQVFIRSSVQYLASLRTCVADVRGFCDPWSLKNICELSIIVI